LRYSLQAVEIPLQKTSYITAIYLTTCFGQKTSEWNHDFKRTYLPTLIKTWSRINVTSGLNIWKMVRKTELNLTLAPSISYHISFILI